MIEMHCINYLSNQYRNIIGTCHFRNGIILVNYTCEYIDYIRLPPNSILQK